MKKNEDLNSWQPATDMFTGLLLILLLIILLLMFYILKMPKKEEDFSTQASTSWEDTTESGSTRDEEDSDEEGETTQEEATTEIPSGGGEPNSEGMKSAVYAVIVDAETKKTIEKKDVEFQLYQNKKSLQTLYTYYPKKTGYKKFATTKNGDFYLPEKIWEGNYFFRQLTEVDGYNNSGDTSFSIDKLYDWPDPYVVSIKLKPASSIIYVSMQDQETGTSIPEGEFRIVAEEDIITKDGSVRFKEGESAGKIVIDEKGEGESKKLYLGKYRLEQTKIPKNYAAIENEPVITVQKAMKKDKATVIKNEKTKIRLSLHDELYSEQALSNIEFILKSDKGKEIHLTTDANGMAETDEIKKNHKYTLTQKTIPKGYENKVPDTVLAVDTKGYIGGSAVKELSLTNRKIRISIDIRESILKNILEEKVVLCDKNKKEVASWDTGNISADSIKPGDYIIKVHGKEFPITIQDEAQIQNFSKQVLTLRGIVAIALAISAVFLLIVGIIFVIRKIRKKGEN